VATIEHHQPPLPESCEVCRYLQERPEFDARREHTLAMIAQAIMIQDLNEAGVPLRMVSIYQESIGFPGPQQRVEPRHWLLALLETSEIRLMIDEGVLEDG
jgi:hypothetical protein